MGKTLVATIKTNTISKLALQAALHASRIEVYTIEEHCLTIDFRGGDSLYSLNWKIKYLPTKYKRHSLLVQLMLHFYI